MAISDVSAARRRADLAKLRELQARLPRAFEITKCVGDPVRSLELRVTIPTAKDDSFPRSKQAVSVVEVQLPESYPFPPGPHVQFKTEIWNPNVFTGGKWCYGEWQITENLELFVMRLLKVVALDPTIVNPASPANREAASWYRRMQSTPGMFPSVDLGSLGSAPTKPAMVWRTVR
jgi:ubiquitin-protein ligase